MSAARWKLILYLAAIFAAGGASGWMVAVKTTREKAYQRFQHDRVAQRYIECLRTELKLTEEQERKIGTVVDHTAEQMKAVHNQHMKRVGEIVSNRNDQILAVLDPEQRKVFQENEARRQQEIREKFRSRGSRDKDRDRDRGDSRRKGREISMDEKCETNNSSRRQ